MEKTQEEIQSQASTSGAEPTVETTTQTVDTTTQDPLKKELERVEGRATKTEADKAAFSLRKNADRARELGIDPAEILGLKKPTTTQNDDEDDDDAPVTMGMLKKMQQSSAVKTALDLTSDIANETERELTRFHLQNTIKSTGNPNEDLSLARALVNASKNGQIIEEARRQTAPVTQRSAEGAPGNFTQEPELTEEELSFMQKPFNLTKEAILAARKK